MDLKHLLLEAKQRVPPVLVALGGNEEMLNMGGKWRLQTTCSFVLFCLTTACPFIFFFLEDVPTHSIILGELLGASQGSNLTLDHRPEASDFSVGPVNL